MSSNRRRFIRAAAATTGGLLGATYVKPSLRSLGVPGALANISGPPPPTRESDRPTPTSTPTPEVAGAEVGAVPGEAPAPSPSSLTELPAAPTPEPDIAAEVPLVEATRIPAQLPTVGELASGRGRSAALGAIGAALAGAGLEMRERPPRPVSAEQTASPA